MSAPPEPGVYEGVPFPDYLSWDAVSSSYLRDIVARGTLIANHRKANSKTTPAMLDSSALHAYVLDDRAEIERYDAGTTKTTIVGREDDQGRTLIGTNAEAMIGGMVEALEKDKPIALARFRNAAHEVSIVWDDPLTGIRCKARLDALSLDDKWGGDYKSAAAGPAGDKIAEPSGRLWDFEFHDRGYHLQMAMYAEAIRVACNIEIRFDILAQSKAKPYPAMWKQYDSNDPWMDFGATAYRRGLEDHQICTSAGEWPAHPDRAEGHGCPAWVETRTDALERRGLNFGF